MPSFTFRIGSSSARSKPINLLFFLFMASMMSIFLLSLVLLAFPSSSSSIHSPQRTVSKPNATGSVSPVIVRACQATRFPDTCESTLVGSGISGDASAMDVIQSAIKVSLSNLTTAQGMVKSILDSSSGSVNRTNAATNCIELLNDSHYRTTSTIDYALPAKRTKDALAWMSAALLYQYDCGNAFKYANDTSKTDELMQFMNSLILETSNALSMIHSLDAYGSDMSLWSPPKTERDGYWTAAGAESPSSEHGPGAIPPKSTSDVTVCKGNGGCDYDTVQAAVNAAPNNSKDMRFVIHIKEGVYDEIVRVPLEKINLMFLGDGMGKTIITGSRTARQPGITTYNTATVGVLADGFMANGLTIQNTAGAPTYQAVAFRSDSDRSVIENCEFIGNQDTLYAHGLRQYYRSCRIIGNMDFIFGNSAAVFEDTVIIVKPRQRNPEKGERNALTAHGRTDPAQSTGFVFRNCTINGSEDYLALVRRNSTAHQNFMGRPWKEYSRTVFIRCNLGAIISPPGWLPWSGDLNLKTLFYGEFENTGPGSGTSKRVSWSTQIPPQHVDAYSLENFIQGSSWIPSTSKSPHRN